MLERHRRWLGRTLTTVGVVVLAAVTALGGVAWSWGETLRSDQRLLPGVYVAGLEVGGTEFDAARDAAATARDPALDHSIEVVHEQRSWHTTPRALGATTDVDDVMASAFERTRSASVVELARYRWLDHGADLHLDVSVVLPDDTTTRFVDRIARQVDRSPRDAAYVWNGNVVVVEPAQIGVRVDRDATAAALRLAADDGTGTVELPVTHPVPQLLTEVAEHVLPDVRAAVDAALDRVVTLTYGSRTWEVTARDLDAVPDLTAIQETITARAAATPPFVSQANLVSGGLDGVPVPLSLPNDAVAAFAEELAGDIDIAPTDAQIAWTGTELAITPEETGIALTQGVAARQVVAALTGTVDRVELPVATTYADITTRSFDQVLLVLQDERRLELRRGNEVVHEWPVAVGQGGSPTPTGVFQVGAKRFEPTWYNPDPTGWGRDMPKVVPPGPTNPLGLRALNWNRNGVDTLIRFHGTPNEASIGSAASRGCVRMFNRDAIELYDLVDSGIFIVSVNS